VAGHDRAVNKRKRLYRHSERERLWERYQSTYNPRLQGIGGWVGGGMGFEGAGRGFSEAYEAKNERQKMRCLLLRRKKNFFIYL